MKTRRTLAMVMTTLSLALLATAASAESSEEAKRLMKLRDAERYEVSTSHSATKAGAARVHIAAPVANVKKAVTDFKNYSKFISKFDKAKVVGRDGDKTDVYLQVPILKGAAKIWAVVRFEPMKTVNGEEVLEGQMIKGNVKRMDARWRIKKIDDENTQLNLELLIVPKLPVPGSMVTGEVKYAADEAVMGSRNRVEREWNAKKKK
jgi:ribosome-associated toxin RatA of RatAB toxin-antitoxin module